MAYTIAFYYAVGLGSIMSALSFIFTIIMIGNFFKKRTVGTGILAMMFSMIFIQQLFNTLFNIYSRIAPYETMQKISILIYLGALFMVYSFLYFFTSRHILQDNDIVRIFYSIILFGLNYIILGLMGYEMFRNIDVDSAFFYEIRYQAATEMFQTQPSLIASLIIYIPLVLLVQIRILIVMSSTLIKKKQKDPVRRRGFLYILLSVISLFASLLLTILFIIEGLSQTALILIYSARAITVILTLYFSYVGWILPDWFKRRVRGKAWIADKIAIGTQPKGTFVSSTTLIEETRVIKEVTEV